MIANAVHTLAHVYKQRSLKKNLLLGLSDAYFARVFMGSATSVHLIFLTAKKAGVRRRALARRNPTDNASWDRVPLARPFLQMRTNHPASCSRVRSYTHHRISSGMTSFWLCLKLDKRDWHYSMCGAMTTLIHSLLCIFFNPLPHVYTLRLPLRVSMCVFLCGLGG